ncbi:hypothetical protein, partial [Alishewanella longhuensis]
CLLLTSYCTGKITRWRSQFSGEQSVSFAEAFIDTLLFLIGSVLFFVLVIKLESMIPINYLDKVERTFSDLGTTVQVRPNSYSRFYNTKGRLIKKSDISKIQMAGCLTLFTLSDNAIDITVHPANRDIVFKKAKSIFTEAQVVEIDMQS